MKHYLGTDGLVYAFENDGSQDEFIPEGATLLTEERLAEIRAQQEADRLASLTYVDQRLMEYPDFREYLDGVVKGDQAQIDAYIAACLAVKAKYPKP